MPNLVANSNTKVKILKIQTNPQFQKQKGNLMCDQMQAFINTFAALEELEIIGADFTSFSNETMV